MAKSPFVVNAIFRLWCPWILDCYTLLVMQEQIVYMPRPWPQLTDCTAVGIGMEGYLRRTCGGLLLYSHLDSATAVLNRRIVSRIPSTKIITGFLISECALPRSLRLLRKHKFVSTEYTRKPLVDRIGFVIKAHHFVIKAASTSTPSRGLL